MLRVLCGRGAGAVPERCGCHLGAEGKTNALQELIPGIGAAVPEIQKSVMHVRTCVMTPLPMQLSLVDLFKPLT